MKAVVWNDPHDPDMLHVGSQIGKRVYHAAAIHTDLFADIFGEELRNEAAQSIGEIIKVDITTKF